MRLIIGKAYKVCDGETTVSAYLISIAPHEYRFRSAQDELDFVVYQMDLDAGTPHFSQIEVKLRKKSAKMLE